jgi:hypothetical protein
LFGKTKTIAAGWPGLLSIHKTEFCNQIHYQLTLNPPPTAQFAAIIVVVLMAALNGEDRYRMPMDCRGSLPPVWLRKSGRSNDPHRRRAGAGAGCARRAPRCMKTPGGYAFYRRSLLLNHDF